MVVMSEGLIFAVLAALVFGFWTVFHKQASTYVTPVFGAVVVSATAAVLGSVILLLARLKPASLTPLYSSPKGILFAAIVGVFALLTDVLVLKSYGSGFPLSLGGPVVIGGSIMVASFVGLLFLGESASLAKMAGIALVIAGAGILASLGK